MNKSNFTRIKALIHKEGQQMLRDSSALTLGIVLPFFLLLLFGFGLSMDVKNVPITLVQDTSSPLTRDLYMALRLSPYINPSVVHSWQEAENKLRLGQTQAIVRRALQDSSDGQEHIQIIVNGRDSNTASIMQRYVEGAVMRWASVRQTPITFLSAGTTVSTSVSTSGNTAEQMLGRASPEVRTWYNSELESRYFLIPGVTALIMTLIGTLLTALIVAREWERGTYEALVATPVRGWEILLGKVVPYFGLGLVGLALCLIGATCIFGVPVRSSILLIIFASALYLLVALGLGLFISATIKKQFLASQVVLIFSFLPTMLLSGFIFELRNAPTIAYYFAHIFPATWYVDLLQTLFLVGAVPQVLIHNMLVLLCFAFFLFFMASKKVRKSLE